MNASWPFLLFFLIISACKQQEESANTDNLPGRCDYCDTSRILLCSSGRGALLATRFTSFEDLKSVVRIEYDSLSGGHYRVRVWHGCKGNSIVGVLETGVSQGDFMKARYDGTPWNRLALLFRCPYAIANRKDLEKAFNLSRRSPEWFGEGDPAFYDLAQTMAANINTPDLAIKNARDTTEKGYLNTFNHFSSQAFITSCFSEELADFIADAHERYRHPELMTGQFTEAQIKDLNEGPVDNYVDLVNNEWGQETGKRLKEKYGIKRETSWTPGLLANYLNDLQSYYSWAFQIGFKPCQPDDGVIVRFSNKVNAVMGGRVTKGRWK